MKEIQYNRAKYNICILFYLLLLILYPLLYAAHAEIIERVVAFIDDDAIMLSEFNKAYEIAVQRDKNISKKDVLNTMINRRLLLKEAERLHISPENYTGDKEDAIIREYIDTRIKAFIRIPMGRIEAFYNANKERFKGRPFYEVKNDIERLLLEEEVNKRLLAEINKLREKSYIWENLDGARSAGYWRREGRSKKKNP